MENLSPSLNGSDRYKRLKPAYQLSVKFILTFGNQNLTKEGKWKGKLEPIQKDLASLRNNSLARDVQVSSYHNVT
jgi:hypothetical protein